MPFPPATPAPKSSRLRPPTPHPRFSQPPPPPPPPPDSPPDLVEEEQFATSHPRFQDIPATRTSYHYTPHHPSNYHSEHQNDSDYGSTHYQELRHQGQRYHGLRFEEQGSDDQRYEIPSRYEPWHDNRRSHEWRQDDSRYRDSTHGRSPHYIPGSYHPQHHEATHDSRHNSRNSSRYDSRHRDPASPPQTPSPLPPRAMADLFTSNTSNVRITLSQDPLPQDGIVSGDIHFTPPPLFHLHNITLHLYCETTMQPPLLREIFAGDGDSPFQIPLRPCSPSHPHRILHKFSFALPSNLPHSHTFHLLPHIPGPPIDIAIAYRLVATCTIIPAINGRETTSPTITTETPLGLEVSPLATHTSYLPLYTPTQTAPQATWASGTSDHAIAIALPRAYTALHVPFPICVSIRIPGATSVVVEAHFTEHVAWNSGPLFKQRKVGKRGATVSVSREGVGNVRLELSARSVYPSARVGDVGVAHGIEAFVRGWWSGGRWIEGGMGVSIPVVVLPQAEAERTREQH